MKLHKSFLLIAVLFSLITTNGQDKPAVGTKAPDFILEDAYGNEYQLSSYIGKSPVVIYFYPKAGTAGCTKQACGIRDDWSKFEENNIVVLGISTDNTEEIKKFIDDYSLNFPLLSDINKNVSKNYGVLRDNGTAERVTFIIDLDGNIADMFAVKDINSHSEYVFNTALSLLEKKE